MSSPMPHHVPPPRRRRRPGQVRRAIALVLSAILVGTIAHVPAYAAAAPGRPANKPIPRVPVEPAGAAAPMGKEPSPAQDKAAPVWPAPGAAVVDVVAATGARRVAARAGGLPVGAARAAGSATATPQRVRLQVLDRVATANAGVRGVLLRVDRADADASARTASADVSITVDYGAFATAYGGDWGSRLRLVSVPDCAIATPDAARCQGRPLPTRNDAAAKTATATVSLAAGGSFVALAAGDSGPSGDYKATSLKPSSTWTAGGNSGAFNWSYPMRVPPALGGPAPDLALSYSSQSVDGRHAASNNQPSIVGEGFEAAPGGYIERSYTACATDMDGSANNDEKTGDQCWETDNATLSLGNASGELIYNASEGRWHLRSDEGSRIERKTGASNGDNNGEHWVVTKTDGTQYWFGLNRLPGWATNDPQTNSAWNVPIFGNDPGEPCHATAFKDSDCVQTWRWNLDYIVDVNGNSMSYWYTKEQNRYLQSTEQDDKALYDRAGWLDHVSYGTRRTSGVDNVLDVIPPFRVDFGMADRCLATCATHDELKWPDTPWDQECTASQDDCDNFSPTFWTTKRLSTITTRVRNAAGTGHDNVERWTLGHTFPDPGDGTRAGLWLSKISHAGLVGSTTTMPDIEFTPVQLSNRVDTEDFAAAMNWMRIARVRTESGGTINVTYSEKDCQPGATPTPHTNTRLCYPVIWKPEGYDDYVTDWFHKYVVKTIYEIDHTGGVPPKGSPRVIYTYTYHDGVAWHYADDDGLIEKAQKTWSSFRGYGRVGVTIGDAGEQSYSETRFFRGMHGDRAAPSGGTRSAAVDGIADEDWYHGLIRESKTFDGPGGPVVSRQISDPWSSGPTASRTINGDTVTARFVRTGTVWDRTTLDAGRGERVTKSTTTYDSLGMPVSVDDFGQDGVPGDERCTKSDYTPRNDAAWLMDRVHRTQTYAVACSATGGTLTDDDILGESRTFYDGATTFETAPTRGLPTRAQVMSAWNAGAPTFANNGRKAYDVHGRVTEAWNALDVSTKTTFTPATDGPVRSTTTTNVLGHTTTTTLQPAWGSSVTTTDPNDKKTELAYDGLGRLTSAWLPGRVKGTHSANMTFGYDVRPDGATAISTSRLTNAGTYNTSWLLLDGMLRERQTQDPSPSGGRIITETFYDSAGRKVKRFDGYHATGTPSADLVTAIDRTSVPSQSRTVYDGAGRVTAEVFQPYDAERWRSTTYYAGDRTDGTPPAGGTPTSSYTDARGQVMQLRHYTGPTPTPNTAGSWKATSYEYNRKGQLKKVTDAAGNIWTYRYDIRGRQYEVDDPDKGVTSTTYDNAGRVTSTTDARGKKLVFGYDQLDRKRVLYENQAGGPIRAQWTYDTIAKGLLSQSLRQVGAAQYVVKILGYTDSYEPTGKEVVIPASETGLGGSYLFNYTYNIDDSVATSSLPSAGGMPLETLTHGYDTFGRPTKVESSFGTNPVASLVSDADYNALGQLEQYELYTGTGGRVWQAFTRELETGRVTGVKTQRDSVAPYVLTDFQYSYDKAGNVTATRDSAPDPVDDTQCFAYDYLRRLTEAWTPAGGDCNAARSVAALGGPAAYWHSWTYDAANNRKTQTVRTSTGDATTTYNYPATGADRPHGVTSTTGASTGGYSYDAAGNMLTRPTATSGQQTMAWDAEGEIESSTDASGVTTYLYDADGNRLVRRDPAGRTLYLPGQEVRYSNASQTTACVRYYTFAGNTVASRNASGLTWLGVDHQNTAQVAVNAATQAATIRRQAPYGGPRGGDPAWANDKGFLNGTKDNTGLTHLGARMYDTSTGAFISVDPLIDVMDPRSLNGYGYGWHNPLTFADADGNWPSIFNKVAKAIPTPTSVINSVVASASNGLKAAGNAVAGAGKWAYQNADKIALVAGAVALCPIPPLNLAAGAVAVVAGAVAAGKDCAAGKAVDCAIGVAAAIPGVGAPVKGLRVAKSIKKSEAAIAEARDAQKYLATGSGALQDQMLANLKNISDPAAYNRTLDRFMEARATTRAYAQETRAVQAGHRAGIESAYRSRYPWEFADKFFLFEGMLWQNIACQHYGDCEMKRDDIDEWVERRGGGSSGGGSKGGGSSGGGSKGGGAPAGPPAPSGPLPPCENIKVPGGWLLC